MNKRRLELLSNAIIFLLVLIAIIISITSAEVRALPFGYLDIFKYFTVESNVLVGIASLLSFILILTNKYSDIFKIIKYISVTAVSLTCITALVYLSPLLGFMAVNKGANFIMHIVVPILAIIHLLLLETKLETPKFKYTFLSIIPMSIYGVGYFINLGVTNTYGDYRYDFYGFGQFGPYIGIAIYLVMAVLTYSVGLLLYLGYKKIQIKTSN